MACECRWGLVKGPQLQVEAVGLYGELREWLPGPSSSWRLLRRLCELNVCRTVERIRIIIVVVVANIHWVGALTRAVSVGGRRPTKVRAGKEGGQAGEVCVLAGEEGLALFSWSHQTGLRGETGERI